MEDLVVLTCGTNYRHPKGFTFLDDDRAFKDCYIFSFFKTPFISMTRNGACKGNAYSYILHSPYSKVYHATPPDAKTGFTNDWMYLKGAYVDELIQRMNIITDAIVPMQYNKDSITKINYKLQSELPEDLPFKNDRIKTLITDLFIELARNNWKSNMPINENEFAAINKVRKIIQKDFKNKWTLNSMSKLSQYSTSYFLFLYKKCYGKSPVDDLIDYRITQAKFMLESNTMTISEIADECGFGTLYYFSRVFKDRVGLSPSEYKKNFFEEN